MDVLLTFKPSEIEVSGVLLSLGIQDIVGCPVDPRKKEPV